MYQSGEKLHTLSLKILIFSPIYYYNFIEVQKKKIKTSKTQSVWNHNYKGK